MNKILLAVVLGLVGCAKDGKNGVDGQSIVGPKGETGQACTLSEIVGGRLLSCGTSTVIITNGVDGSDGQSITGPRGSDGSDAVVEVIQPCGDAPGIYDEVLLRLSSGQILASFSDNSNGQNTRFSIIPAGTYSTTDSTGCVFTVHNDLSVTW